MKHGFIKLASAIPEVTVACQSENAKRICDLIDKAYAEGVAVLVFPELSVTGATCGDLFHTDSLINNTLSALAMIKDHTAGKKMLTFVGAPLKHSGKLYNCAVVISDGKVLGIVPKKTDDSSELRWFTQFTDERYTMMDFLDETVLFDANQIFYCEEQDDLRVGCEIGEEVGNDRLAKMGATVIVNMSASPEIVGSEDYRRTLVRAASGRLVSAYVLANAGSGESTTDCVYAGHSMIAERGKILAENHPFGGNDLITAVVDVQHIAHDRMVNNSFEIDTDSISWRYFSLDKKETDIRGAIERSPFVPSDEADKKATFKRILDIQAHGLAKRITASRASGCVIALSGGLDSTLALIVTARALDILGRPHSDITAVTLPCFGTTSRTRSNAEAMAIEFGTAFRAIDIKEAVDIHFRDIGHDPDNHSVVYENSQARERTQIIMDIANAENGLVIGTGDLSELALGWATYNGDHMSNYGVNGGVPKTLVRHIVSYFADECEAGGKASLASVLRDVLATPVSPELLPAKDGKIAQKTEDIVGPYDLHDFFLYHFVRYGEEPEKIFREATVAFDGEFSREVILKWLNTFTRRFYSQQFKRSALPDGPKVGSVALSPRGAWQMPSDACGCELQLADNGGAV